jgi:L-amino acid N-acyltransferase YncA
MHSDAPPAVIQIRPCEERDVAAVQKIYAHYVVNSLASFVGAGDSIPPCS